MSARPCRRKLTLPWSSKTRGGRPRGRLGQQACCQGCRGPPLGRLTATSKRLEVAQKEPLYSGTCSVVNHRSLVKYRHQHSIPLQRARKDKKHWKNANDVEGEGTIDRRKEKPKTPKKHHMARQGHNRNIINNNYSQPPSRGWKNSRRQSLNGRWNPPLHTLMGLASQAWPTFSQWS